LDLISGLDDLAFGGGKMKRIVLVAVALGFSSTAAAFDVKGYAPGMDAANLDLTACEKVSNADSGVPGFRCDRTLGGDSAELRIGVFDDKVVLLTFIVRNGRMTATRDALIEKFGAPVQPNRYIETYQWSGGGQVMAIKENRQNRPDQGYTVLLYDRMLFDKAKAAAGSKAKKDI
jgi:hypothetical protein